MLGKDEQTSRVVSYVRQETVLILLYILVLASLFLTHIFFISLLGPPGSPLVGVLTFRFITLILELLWLQKLGDETPEKVLKLHTQFSVWLNIAVAFSASTLSGTADSHYAVLMVVPIVTAAYRWKFPGTILVVGVAIVLTFLEVYIYFAAHPPSDPSEYFEAATVTLIFLVVGVIVRLLVGSLRRKEERLESSLVKLREMQEKLVAEERLSVVGKLSSAVAHEIRNPVAMIASSLQMARKSESSRELREEMFGIAFAESKRLETLTTDFLTYGGQKKPVREVMRVGGILEYAAMAAKAKLAEKNLRLEIDCESDAVFSVDAGQMRQAVLNLIMNAADASRDGLTIRAGCEEGEENVVFFVENTGPKIADESQLFEPFYTTRQQGVGLGLAIVRKIAQVHGGEAVLAVNEDERVRFEIVLPKVWAKE